MPIVWFLLTPNDLPNLTVCSLALRIALPKNVKIASGPNKASPNPFANVFKPAKTI